MSLHGKQQSSEVVLYLRNSIEFIGSQVIEMSGERGGNRTYNLLIKSQLLCQLSYAPVCSWWGMH